MIHNHRKGVVMSSLWRQSRSLRNESKLFSDTINKSKESKSPVGNFFDFIKQWWLLISGGSFALIIALMVGGYSSVFSGDIGASIEYVQAYVFSAGTIKVTLYLILAVLIFTVILFLPAHATQWWFEKKRQGKSKLKRILWVGAVYITCIMGDLFVALILTFLSGGYSALYTFIYLLFVTSIFVTWFIILGSDLWGKIDGVIGKRRRRSWTTGFLIALMVVITLWQPANVLSLINGGDDKGYMACVYGDRNINGKSEFFKETVIPLSYDTKGVQVFIGDYNEDVNKWSNIRQEYLYFDQGYSIKRGEKCPE